MIGSKCDSKRLPPPSNAEVARLTVCIARRVSRLLDRRWLGPGADPEEADPLPRDQPLLAELYTASVQGRIVVGDHAAIGTRPLFHLSANADGKSPHLSVS